MITAIVTEFRPRPPHLLRRRQYNDGGGGGSGRGLERPRRRGRRLEHEQRPERPTAAAAAGLGVPRRAAATAASSSSSSDLRDDGSAIWTGLSEFGLRQVAGDRAAAGAGAHSRGRRPGTHFCGIRWFREHKQQVCLKDHISFGDLRSLMATLQYSNNLNIRISKETEILLIIALISPEMPSVVDLCQRKWQGGGARGPCAPSGGIVVQSSGSLRLR